MKMSPNELKGMLETVCENVYYNHTTTEDVVNYPYIVFLDNRGDSFFADGITYYEGTPYIIILHTAERDYELESELKSVLTQNKFAYRVNDITWNRTYLFWQVSFLVESY